MRVLSSSPHLESPFELLFDQEDLVATGSCMQYRWLGFDHLGSWTSLVDRFSTAEACNIATGIFSSLCWEGVRFIPAGARICHTSGKRGLTYCSKKREVGEVLKKKRKKFWGWKKKTGEQRARNKGLSGLGMTVRLLPSDWGKVPSGKLPGNQPPAPATIINK